MKHPAEQEVGSEASVVTCCAHSRGMNSKICLRNKFKCYCGFDKQGWEAMLFELQLFQSSSRVPTPSGFMTRL